MKNSQNEISISDEAAMTRAIEIAKIANGKTHPNPLVGAVIVENGKIAAEGFHEKAGTAHAEKIALKNFGKKASAGTTLFVTLEPCSTKGKTGACTDAILASGIKKVVVGATDPNPAHRGNGLKILRERGIEVVSGVLEKECENLNPIFNHFIQKNSPLFAAKCALFEDGKMFEVRGKQTQITGTEARKNVMRERQYFPAIAAGAGTILSDNPALTARLGNDVFCPIRFVFDRSGKTLSEAKNLKIFTDEFSSKTVFVTSETASGAAKKNLEKFGVKILSFPSSNNVPAFWKNFRSYCFENSIFGVYFEGGEILLKSLFAAQEADFLFAYVAGTPKKSPEKFFNENAKISVAGTRNFGNDVEIFGPVSYC